MDSEADRRRYPRLPLDRPLKLQDLATGRYVPGRSVDVSTTGLLVEVSWSTPLRPGQRVRVGLPATDHAGWLAASSLATGTIVRQAGATRLAISLDRPEASASLSAAEAA